MERTNVPDNAIYSDPGYKTLKHLQNQERKKSTNPILQNPDRYIYKIIHLILDIKTRPATTTTRRPRVIHDAKLAPDQFHRIIHRATGQKFQ